MSKEIENPEEINDPNVVKAVFDREGFALYFSRAPIPYRSAVNPDFIRMPRSSKSISGMYSYRRNTLLSLADMEPTELEKIEKLEQLRALENGMKIKGKGDLFETCGVDTPEDLERVEKCLSTSL